MSRTSRSSALRVVDEKSPDDALEQAKAAERQADEALAAARAAEDVAVQKYDETGDEKDQDVASKARLARERCERVLQQRKDATVGAQAVVWAAERDAAKVRYEELVARVVSMPELLKPHADRLSALRATAAEQVEQIADVVVDLEEAYLELGRLDEALGLDVQRRVDARPSIEAAQLLVQVSLEQADRRAARDVDVSPWVSALPEPKWNDPSLPAYQRAVQLMSKKEK